MQELISILSAHAARYPKMEPTDAVKLLFQNEFGGGHLIRDPESCLGYLRREYASTPRRTDIPLYEDIGNQVLRVNLAALPEADLDALGNAFLRSAAAHRGNLDRFREKLEILRQLTAQGIFSFGPTELNAYLLDYEKAGFPPVSHSQTYRDAYRPAYRIITRP